MFSSSSSPSAIPINQIDLTDGLAIYQICSLLSTKLPSEEAYKQKYVQVDRIRSMRNVFECIK